MSMKRLLASILLALFTACAIAQSTVTTTPAAGPGFNRFSPGAIGGTTPAAITGTTITATNGFNVGASDVVLTRYAAKKLMISGDGIGAGVNAGIIAGYYGSSGYGALWSSAVAPDTTNHMLIGNATDVYLNAVGTLHFGLSGADKATISSTAGSGLSITAGTATTDVNALSATQTWNNGAVTFTANKTNVTNTASGASSLLEDWQIGGVSKASIGLAGDIKIGNTLNSVSPTAPNRTITMVVGGVTVYIAAKTTND